ncbi:MAG TPA: LLM class F420-dependent oxidoreductase [Candidatus Margulisiibacteriota bacterium]|nr:LLM class F420-dependent oxidoreductase [Candidatus Margulisiibacteriota bacterium]
MRYGIALPNYGALAGPENLLRLARRAEECGADSVWVSDHVIIPDQVASVYPYDASPRPAPALLQRLEPFYDALTTLAFIAGATTRVRLGVSVYVVPIRNPVLTAKIVASLDALSRGRVIFGCGVGWLREEFDALHAPFADRGARTDEYLRICQALWTQDVAPLPGPLYAAAAIRARPKPAQQPYPPIWIGGNSDAALRRAVRLGTGWHPIDLSPAAIASKRAVLQQLCAAAGRDAGEITISLRGTLRFVTEEKPSPAYLAGAPQKIRADVAAYARAGVQYMVLTLRDARTVDEMTTQLERVAGEVMHG